MLQNNDDDSVHKHTRWLRIQVLSEESPLFSLFLSPQPHSSEHVDAIPGYLEWKVSIGHWEQSRNKKQRTEQPSWQEFLVSTTRHRPINRDSHCLSDGMWAYFKHVGVQTCPLSALSAFYSTSHPSDAAKRNDQIESKVQKKGWWELGGGVVSVINLYLICPELALIARLLPFYYKRLFSCRANSTDCPDVHRISPSIQACLVPGRVDQKMQHGSVALPHLE